MAFHHFDLYAQALAKIERGHAQDVDDVREMLRRGLVEPGGCCRISRRLSRVSIVIPRSTRYRSAARSRSWSRFRSRDRARVDTLAPDAPRMEVGFRLGHDTVVRALGHGGMGEVPRPGRRSQSPGRPQGPPPRRGGRRRAAGSVDHQVDAPSIRHPSAARTRSKVRSAPAGWARSIARTTRGWGAMWRSKSCPRP